jgi:asparagine synthase (glutamine-hydrolysing)
MCGIAGVFSYGTTREVDADVLAAMRSELRHRGPDGEGLWCSADRRIGLANTRLAILDFELGQQPMTDGAGLVVVFNGEIYNYPELRRSLEREGAAFKSRCDTEVILHLYRRYGFDCVKHLNGMFAFAVWDPRRAELFFARDRIGEKPFYFTDVGGTFVFGSEIKALLQHPLVTPAVNEAALDGYLTNLVTTSPETLFAAIHKLPPGHRGSCSASGVRTESYWSAFSPRRFDDVSIATAAHTVRNHLERSVSQRLLSDVPVGILLSGGLDSTTLAALLQERAQGIATFSVGFDAHPEFDEREHARRVAHHFRTDHHEVILSEREALSFLPKLVYHQDEPLADPVCMPLYFVCGLARKQEVPVVLAGEGSDELFWGYGAYSRIMARERWLRRFVGLPRIARQSVVTAWPKQRHPRLRDLVEGMASGRPLPMHMPLGLTYRQRVGLLGRKDLDRRAGWRPSEADDGGLDMVDRLAFDTQEYEFGLRLPELLLMRIDRFSMAHGVEARVPFLDPELVSYVYRLPLFHKLWQGESKRALRAAISDIVPEWVIQRPKQGFGAPVASWFGSLFGDLMIELLRGEAVRRYFDAGMIERALAAARRGARHQLDLWPIFNFALWHRHWIEGASVQRDVEPYAAVAVR